jgi:hypothetical protein
MVLAAKSGQLVKARTLTRIKLNNMQRITAVSTPKEEAHILKVAKALAESEVMRRHQISVGVVTRKKDRATFLLQVSGRPVASCYLCWSADARKQRQSWKAANTQYLKACADPENIESEERKNLPPVPWLATALLQESTKLETAQTLTLSILEISTAWALMDLAASESN